MDASLRVAVERLYSKLNSTLALIDGMHRVRLGPPGCIGEKPEEIGPAFWRAFDTCGNSFASLCKTLSGSHEESRTVVQDPAIERVIFQTLARQSLAFKPGKALTFCGEAIERLHSLSLFYHRLLNRMNIAHRNDSEMFRLYRESESLWDEFGFSKGDFDELHRGLAWEFATVCDMQGWNVKVGESTSKSQTKTRTKTTSRGGRKRVTKVTETQQEKQLWQLHKNQGKSAAIIAIDLGMTQEEVQKAINRMSRRAKRIKERKNSDVLTDS